MLKAPGIAHVSQIIILNSAKILLKIRLLQRCAVKRSVKTPKKPFMGVTFALPNFLGRHAGLAAGEISKSNNK